MKVGATFVGALFAVCLISKVHGLTCRDGVSAEGDCPTTSAAGDMKFIECSRGCATLTLAIHGPFACKEAYYGCFRGDGECERAAEYMKRFMRATDPALDTADIISGCEVCKDAADCGTSVDGIKGSSAFGTGVRVRTTCGILEIALAVGFGFVARRVWT